MSWAAKKWVRRHAPVMKASRKAVLLELALDADDAGRGAYLSTAQLSAATDLSPSTVKRALRDLATAQLIVRHQGGRGHCTACSSARRGAHVFDVVIPEPSEVADPHQLNLLNQEPRPGSNQPDPDPGSDRDLGHPDPGSWVTLTQQEEVEDCSLSLDQVRAESEKQEQPSLDEAELQRVAREGAQTREAPKRKPVSYRGRTVEQATVRSAERLLDVFNDATGPGPGLAARGRQGQATAALKQIIGALLERPDEPVEVWERGMRAMIADPPSWIESRLMIGHLFGQRAAEHTLSRGRGDTPAATYGSRGLSASEWGAIAANLRAREEVAA